jgi:hypothetical protein
MPTAAPAAAGRLWDWHSILKAVALCSTDIPHAASRNAWESLRFVAAPIANFSRLPRCCAITTQDLCRIFIHRLTKKESTPQWAKVLSGHICTWSTDFTVIN